MAAASAGEIYSCALAAWRRSCGGWHPRPAKALLTGGGS
jgi:hypothetical protein